LKNEAEIYLSFSMRNLLLYSSWSKHLQAIQKRQELIQQNKDQRRTLNSKPETKPESRQSYIYLSVFILLGIIWWLYSKD